MPRGGNNRMPAEVKRQYFALTWAGFVRVGGVAEGGALSCGSLWFIDAGQVEFIDVPVNPRFLSQDDRIEIADGLARGGAGQGRQPAGLRRDRHHPGRRQGRLKGLPEVVASAWPAAIVQTCIVHLIRNTFHLTSKRDWDAIERDVRQICTAVNAATARTALDELAGKWGSGTAPSVEQITVRISTS